MHVYLNKAHFPVTTLGPGKRIGIWFQGCSLGCPECVSRDTWSRDDSYKVESQTLITWCKDITSNQLDGITISGGEPFEQPEALMDILYKLQMWRNSLSRPFDILCYSGMSYDTLKDKFSPILSQLDALIPEPYISTHSNSTKRWRGSANQPLIILSDLAHEREYYRNDSLHDKHIQFVLDDSRIWFVGVPQENDMEKLETILRKKGIAMEDCSWRA